MNVLLVEDNPENAQLFIRILQAGGFTVNHKLRGLEGLQAARNGAFDAILLDFDLPDIDGSQIGLALRKVLPRTPIIALTAHADKLTRNKARIFGFDAFIAKPCTDEDLLNTVQTLLNRPGSAANPQQPVSINNSQGGNPSNPTSK